MTRQELADAVNVQVNRLSGGRHTTPVNANHIGKWERGVIRWPAAHYRAALRAVLGAATDGELGFRRPTRARRSPPRAAPPALDADEPAPASPRRVVAAGGNTRDLLASLAGPTVHYRRMEQTVSSASLGPAAEAHLTLADEIVRTRCRTPKGYTVLSEIAGLCAWLAADWGDVGTARRHYARAVRHAERADNPLLVAYMVGSLGQYTVETGRPRDGVALLDRATTQLGASSPTIARSWLSSLHAVGHAALGDRRATTAALRRAERDASSGRAEPVWPWVFAFDDAKAARHRATALARLGDARGAMDALAAAAPALTAPKPRALAQLDQASVLADAGRWEESGRLATEAMRVGRDLDSERILVRVRAFHAAQPRRGRATALNEELTVTD
ncbi:hypothetical protein [Actinoalloteichus spitiensis]|uniref:hypothetical protein n=1 Tax=Actinoalloteichus spitiensis TaxID=252394 RepID=UPI0003641DA4|nr:hypothetical protein [Actinoalloteichus spitiensis]